MRFEDLRIYSDYKKVQISKNYTDFVDILERDYEMKFGIIPMIDDFEFIGYSLEIGYNFKSKDICELQLVYSSREIDKLYPSIKECFIEIVHIVSTNKDIIEHLAEEEENTLEI